MLMCQGVEAAYGSRQVLFGVDLAVQEASWLAIVGPNGSGKSTLLRRIAGLLKGSGTVMVDGLDPGALPRAQASRLVALVPQNPVIPGGMSVLDYILLGRTPHRGAWSFPHTSDHRSVSDVLDDLDLAGLRHRPLTDLSGGELQRAVLGRALAQAAPLLLLDEPTTALDLGHAQEVMELVERRRRTEGTTVVAAMHDLTLAAQYCDRMVLLFEGAVAGEGSAAHVLTAERIDRFFSASVAVMPGPDGETVVVPRGRSRIPPALRE